MLFEKKVINLLQNDMENKRFVANRAGALTQLMIPHAVTTLVQTGIDIEGNRLQVTDVVENPMVVASKIGILSGDESATEVDVFFMDTPELRYMFVMVLNGTVFVEVEEGNVAGVTERGVVLNANGIRGIEWVNANELKTYTDMKIDYEYGISMKEGRSHLLTEYANNMMFKVHMECITDRAIIRDGNPMRVVRVSQMYDYLGGDDFVFYNYKESAQYEKDNAEFSNDLEGITELEDQEPVDNESDYEIDDETERLAYS